MSLLLLFDSGSPAGAANASGTPPAVTLSAPIGQASGSATASGTAPSVTLSAPIGTASGAASASGTSPGVTLSAPSGTASGGASASGSAPSITLSAPSGSASGGGPGNASGTCPTITLSAPAGTATGTTAATAGDFLDAAILLAGADSTLAGDFGGRLFKVKATTGNVYPYVVLQDDARLELKTSDTEIHRTTLRFHVYASGADPQAAATAARALADDVETAFEGQYLQWTSGWSSVLVRKDRKHRPTPGKARQGVDVAYLELTFDCRTVRE